MNKLFGFLDGYKTVIGIIGSIAAFVVLVCNQLGDGFQFTDVQTILTGFSALMVAIGLGHKAAKIEELLKK